MACSISWPVCMFIYWCVFFNVHCENHWSIHIVPSVRHQHWFIHLCTYTVIRNTFLVLCGLRVVSLFVVSFIRRRKHYFLIHWSNISMKSNEDIYLTILYPKHLQGQTLINIKAVCFITEVCTERYLYTRFKHIALTSIVTDCIFNVASTDAIFLKIFPRTT